MSDLVNATKDAASMAVTNANAVLRYFLHGLVPFAIVIAVAPELHAIVAIKNAVGSWWGFAFLIPLVGMVTYTLHIGLYFVVTERCLFERKWTASHTNGAGGQATAKEKLNYQLDRWKRRASPDSEIRAIQAGLDRWSANLHFAYCCVLSYLLTMGIVLPLAINRVVWAWVLPLAIVAVGMFVLTWKSDGRATEIEIQIYLKRQSDDGKRLTLADGKG